MTLPQDIKGMIKAVWDKDEEAINQLSDRLYDTGPETIKTAIKEIFRHVWAQATLNYPLNDFLRQNRNKLGTKLYFHLRMELPALLGKLESDLKVSDLANNLGLISQISGVGEVSIIKIVSILGDEGIYIGEEK